VLSDDCDDAEGDAGDAEGVARESSSGPADPLHSLEVLDLSGNSLAK
jgi:hypothetical protein